jgi:integrase/recombinase XerD
MPPCALAAVPADGGIGLGSEWSAQAPPQADHLPTPESLLRHLTRGQAQHPDARAGRHARSSRKPPGTSAAAEEPAWPRSGCGVDDDGSPGPQREGYDCDPSHPPTRAPSDDLTHAVTAYLSRYKGLSREHTRSDLRVFLTWCAGHELHPLTVRRHHLELYVRWLQEVRRYKPSTVSRRTSVVAGFYRTCVIDGVLPRSPADQLRRPTVPAESPTLGPTHPQLEALLHAARQSQDRHDFALVARLGLLGLLGLRIFEATVADITDLGEEHGHRVLRVTGKGTKVVLVPLPPAVGRGIDQAAAGRVTGPILRNSRGRRADRHTATRRLRHLAASVNFAMPHLHPHLLRQTT